MPAPAGGMPLAADRYPRPSTRTIALVALCAAGALAWLRADRVGDAPGGPADRRTATVVPAIPPPRSPRRRHRPRGSAAPGPAIEPTRSPDGATIAFAAWHDGAYRIEAVGADGADGAGRRVIAPPERPADDGAGGRTAAGVATDAPLDAPGRLPDDLRAPAWSADGSAIAYLAGRHGDARLEVLSLGVDGLPDGRAPAVLAPEAAGFGWVAGGRAVVRITVAGGARRISFRDRTRFEAQDLAELSGDPLSLAAGAMAVAWTASPPEVGLPVARQGVARGGDSLAAGRGGLSGGAPDTAASMPIAAFRPGLVDLRDVRVSGARINALLFDDFAALRAEVRASTGADFLGTLSDMWRPIGFFSSASAYFSWHKTGRAFDTQMELRGPGGRRDMVLVREDRAGGRGGPQWRMYLRAGEQDGTIGVPLTVPGWTFSAGGGDAADEADGGRRASTVPTGYWVDFSALAAAHGWRRISAQTSGSLDWRTDWAGIEYWHYERRDGLRWFEAARQVYTDADLASAFGPDRLRALSIPLSRLARQGFPVGWRGEG